MTKPGKTTGRRRTGAYKRREEVLNAAARVFYAKGYETTTIQDIADSLGILKGSVYYYISSKEDVLFEVLEEVHQAALTTVVAATDAVDEPAEKIRAFVHSLSAFNADNRMRMGILLENFRSLNAHRRLEIVRARDQFDELLRNLISDGQKAGVVRESVDPKLSALAVMGMINAICQWYRPGGAQEPEEIGVSYADLVVRSLACGAEAHTGEHAGCPPMAG